MSLDKYILSSENKEKSESFVIPFLKENARNILLSVSLLLSGGNQLLANDLNSSVGTEKVDNKFNKEFYKIESGKHSAYIGGKIKFLNKNSSLEEFEFYFNIAFERLGVIGKNFQEKVNNFFSSVSLKKLDTGELIVINDSTDKDFYLNCLIYSKKFLIKDLAKYYKKYDLKEYDSLDEKGDEIRSIRNKDKYFADSYYIYFEALIESDLHNSFSEKNKRLVSNMNKEFKNGYLHSSIEYQKKHNDLVLEIDKKIREKALQLKVFEKGDVYFGKEDYFLRAEEVGLKFRGYNDDIFIYTSDGIFLEKIDKKSNKVKSRVLNLIEEYQNVYLSDFLKLEIDQESKETDYYVKNISFVEGFQIPRFYAKKLKDYQDKGFSFKVMESASSYIKILVIKDGFVVGETSKKLNKKDYEYDLYLDVFIKMLGFYEKGDDKNKIVNQDIDIENSIDNRIKFVNNVYDSFFKNKKMLKFDFDEIVKIGVDNNLSLDEIFHLISDIYEKSNNKKMFLGDWNFFGAVYKKFSNFKIKERDFFNVQRAFILMYFKIWSDLILHYPDEAIKRIDEFADIYLSGKINISNNGTNNLKGINYIIIYIVNKALAGNPDLISSNEMQDLFKKYPELEGILKYQVQKQSDYKDLLGDLRGGVSSDFENASGVGEILNLRIRIQKDWIKDYLKGVGVKFDNRVLSDLILSISRNLFLQDQDNSGFLKQMSDKELKSLVEKNLEKILKEREKIFDKKIFGDYDLYHLAHHGQDIGFDFTGTKPTVNAFRGKIGKKDYYFFDAEDIFDEKIRNGKNKLDRFYNQIIKNKGKIQFIVDGHGSSDSFSVLQKYKKTDKLGIVKKSFEHISLTPEQLADIFIKRQKIKDKYNIKDPDMVIFAACKGDYAHNFYSSLNKRSNELSSDFIPPIMITAAEAGQNSVGSIIDTDKEISFQIFRYVLKIGEKGNITFKTFFDNQYDENMDSNPSLFYPIKINGKWTPQQLG